MVYKGCQQVKRLRITALNGQLYVLSVCMLQISNTVMYRKVKNVEHLTMVYHLLLDDNHSIYLTCQAFRRYRLTVTAWCNVECNIQYCVV